MKRQPSSVVLVLGHYRQSERDRQFVELASYIGRLVPPMNFTKLFGETIFELSPSDGKAKR